jgi:hypothetical protein
MKEKIKLISIGFLAGALLYLFGYLLLFSEFFAPGV